MAQDRGTMQEHVMLTELIRRCAMRTLLFLILVMSRADLIAQEMVPGALSGGPADPAEVEAFMDGLLAAHLRDKGIAGATVAIVRDGGVLLAKGYGFADVSARAPVASS